mmetsp:Transcript_91862/g.213560  ORF Transcript_91862/g.213560 Transcript_91862/m.213560 type:complete len:340 (-) Transcript_91862:72-1091(-)|eukprot:CAMPEP_0171058798 /NCGR_PEP_ID=MMETSP0766_2-20121228/2747_1 /TAXON_ID=439317 /ORGANISM="Gambierdiscus australes, Strain CAWD 149" /LENGTH=339 /DNA_ID=CAMNT_0011514131 /DNA_START=79 /DNA_END=1098 /DNA_ORIENTATION=+
MVTAVKTSFLFCCFLIAAASLSGDHNGPAVEAQLGSMDGEILLAHLGPVARQCLAAAIAASLLSLCVVLAATKSAMPRQQGSTPLGSSDGSAETQGIPINKAAKMKVEEALSASSEKAAELSPTQATKEPEDSTDAGETEPEAAGESASSSDSEAADEGAANSAEMPKAPEEPFRPPPGLPEPCSLTPQPQALTPPWHRPQQKAATGKVSLTEQARAPMRLAPQRPIAKAAASPQAESEDASARRKPGSKSTPKASRDDELLSWRQSALKPSEPKSSAEAESQDWRKPLVKASFHTAEGDASSRTRDGSMWRAAEPKATHDAEEAFKLLAFVCDQLKDL